MQINVFLSANGGHFVVNFTEHENLSSILIQNGMKYKQRGLAAMSKNI